MASAASAENMDSFVTRPCYHLTMERNFGNLALTLPARAAGVHVLAHAHGVTVEDCVCHAHARSPAAERMNRRTAIAVVVRGSFHVRASEGEALVGPGTLLLKNAEASHEYRHVDDGGDRTLTFELDDAFVDTACTSFGVARPGHRGRRAFAQLAIPPAPQTAAAVALAERALRTHQPAALHDAALAITALAFEASWAPSHRLASPTAAQTRRVARVLRHVDAQPAADCSLAALGALAGLSSFHFARVFRALVGQTPHQYVMAARLRTAAVALSTTRTPIIEVALDAGFRDLSHFTTSFHRVFGVSPRRYRLGARAEGDTAAPYISE
jgi:AraC family transcriptional regulator